MSKYTAPTPTKIFHMTPFRNLHDILKLGEIRAKNILDQNNDRYHNIAYEGVQEKRKNTLIPIGKGGNLHDYVPFYFAPRSPMLDAIRRGKVVGYDDGQEDICYMVSTVQLIDNARLDYVFTSGHAIMKPVEFFDKLEMLDGVDWEIFFEKPLIGDYAQYWQDQHNPDRPKWIDRKRRRQAEFLIYRKLELEYISEIAVLNSQKYDRIQQLLNKFGVGTPVVVKPEWYFEV